jgi:hypothetical protein
MEYIQKHGNPGRGQQSSSNRFDWPDHSPEGAQDLGGPSRRLIAFILRLLYGRRFSREKRLIAQFYKSLEIAWMLLDSLKESRNR